ncbi:MAG: DUF354 domain-containing protein [Planctomycetes bacterium]|nr:DUF354 domain-containing protein [Planctomycetota bacterium]
MRIWIDLANSPHVLFFRPLRAALLARGHEVAVTARDFAQTLGLAERYGIPYDLVGGHGGARLWRKAANIAGRALALAAWARGRRFDRAVGHNSYAQALAARLLGIPLITLMDYEHQPANHLNFRLARRVIVPHAFPDAALRRFGAAERRVRRFAGLKEDVYLADFVPDPAAIRIAGTFLHPDGRRAPATLDLATEARIIVVLRPPPTLALYHRFDNPLFDAVLAHLAAAGEPVLTLLLARTAEPAAAPHPAAAGTTPRLFLPDGAVDGPNLLACADLLIGAGGTMNREAAVLGTPVVTAFAGKFAAVDDLLVRTGRMVRLTSPTDVAALRFAKKPAPGPAADAPGRRAVFDQVLGYLLEDLAA